MNRRYNFGVLVTTLRQETTENLEVQYRTLQETIGQSDEYTLEESQKVLRFYKAELVRRNYSG